MSLKRHINTHNNNIYKTLCGRKFNYKDSVGGPNQKIISLHIGFMPHHFCHITCDKCSFVYEMQQMAESV